MVEQLSTRILNIALGTFMLSREELLFTKFSELVEFSWEVFEEARFLV